MDFIDRLQNNLIYFTKLEIENYIQNRLLTTFRSAWEQAERDGLNDTKNLNTKMEDLASKMSMLSKTVSNVAGGEFTKMSHIEILTNNLKKIDSDVDYLKDQIVDIKTTINEYIVGRSNVDVEFKNDSENVFIEIHEKNNNFTTMLDRETSESSEETNTSDSGSSNDIEEEMIECHNCNKKEISSKENGSLL